MAEEIKTEEKQVETENKAEVDYAKAAADYKADMFKYKDKAKSVEAELAQMKAEKDATLKLNLEKNEEWKTLYQNEIAAKETAIADLKDRTTKYMNSSKINAVSQAVQFKKAEYAKFVNTESIEVNENGTFNADSLNKEIDRVKQLYPELLKTHSPDAKMPTDAATKHRPESKSLNKMTKDQLLAEYSKANKK